MFYIFVNYRSVRESTCQVIEVVGAVGEVLVDDRAVISPLPLVAKIDSAVGDRAVEDRAVISPLPLVAGPIISPNICLQFLPLLSQQIPQVALRLLLLPGQLVPQVSIPCHCSDSKIYSGSIIRLFDCSNYVEFLRNAVMTNINKNINNNDGHITKNLETLYLGVQL